MSVPELTIWVQPLGGGWTPLGADLGVDVIPESLALEKARGAGATAASFSLKRHTRGSWSDLTPFTPILINIGGVDVWRGRIVRTPKQRNTESIWEVECEGMYAHLADALTNKGYIHTTFGNWVDATSIPGQALTSGTANNFSSGATIVTPAESYGTLAIKIPQGTVYPNNANYGIVLDLGVENYATGAYIDVDILSPGADASLSIRIGGSTDGTLSTVGTNTATIATAAASGNYTGGVSFTNPCRYIIVYVYRATTATSGTDRTFRINEVRAGDTAYVTNPTTTFDVTLTQADVIKGDIGANCPLISSDTSLVADTATVITHFWPDGYATVQDRLSSLLLYDDVQFSLTDEPTPRARLDAIPTTPLWVFDAATDGGSLSDAGANDGQETYSQALVTYTDSNGANQADFIDTAAGSIAIANPTFTTNTTGWFAYGGTITRSTARGYDDTYSLLCESDGTDAAVGPTVSDAVTGFTGRLRAGRTYTLTFAHYPVHANCTKLYISVAGVEASLELKYEISDFTLNAWNTESIVFTTDERVYVSDFFIQLYYADTVASHFGAAGTDVAFFDAFELSEQPDTLIDRRGFSRTVELNLDTTSSATATTLATTFLATAQYPPFKGSITLTGYARKYGTDEYIPVSQMNAGEALLVYDESDPTTGSIGRLGIIERITYSHNEQSADIDLDSRQDILDQIILARKGLA